MTEKSQTTDLEELLEAMKRIPMPTSAWPEQRRTDFRLGVFACLNVVHRKLGKPEVWPGQGGSAESV